MRIGFVGGGKMAEAIVASLIRGGVVVAGDVEVSDVSEERRRLLVAQLAVTAHADNRAVATGVDVLFLAVKPQQLDEVLVEVAEAVAQGAPLVISIAAGKRLAGLAARLPGARLVRVMPNLPALIGAGMSAYCVGAGTTAADRALAARLLGAFGRVLELPEALFDAVTALSGSGPAFCAYYVSALADAAAQLGVPPADATLLATQTLYGTARLLLEGNLSADELIKSVSSARGTTVAGLEVLERSDLRDVLRATLEAAARRSRELSA